MKRLFFTSNTYLNIKDLLVIVCMFVAAQIIASQIVALSLKTALGASLTTGLSMFLTYIMSFLILLLFLVIYRFFRSRRDKLEPIFSNKIFSPSILVWGVLLTLASQIVSDPVVALFPDSSVKMFDQLNSLGNYAILLTVFIAPLLEELVFRGIIFNDVRHSYGSFTAILVSALLFSAVHLNLAQLLPAFIIGIVFGYVYIVSGSVWSVVVLHMINNALAYIFYLIAPHEDLSKPLSEIIKPSYIYYIIYGSAMLLLIGMFVRLIFVCRADNKPLADQVNNIKESEEKIDDTLEKKIDDTSEENKDDVLDENDDNHPTKLTDTSFL